MKPQEYYPVSIGAHSWGHNTEDENDSFTVVDDDGGLRIVMRSYRPGGPAEMEHTIPTECVPSLIRTLIRFCTTGEQAPPLT